MSDTPAMSRPIGGADEFERRMRMLGAPAAAADDPLAELARLVGQDDPFKGRFPKPEAIPGRDRSDPVFEPAHPAADGDAHHSALDDGFAGFHHDLPGTADHADEHAGAAEPLAARGFDPRSYPVEPSPDAWAQSEPELAVDRMPRPAPAAEGSASGRTLIVLAAVVVLTAGGLAASFLARPSGATAGVAASGSGSTPTILAVAGAAKVQPPSLPTGVEGQSTPSTLLDKNKNDGTATAKVVNTVEQPVDLSQAVKPSALAADASSPFPEPRKVKTVVVRADGTILASAADDAPATRAPDLSNAGLAFDTRTAIPMPDRSAPPSDGSTGTAAPNAAPSTAAPGKVTTRAATPARTPAVADGDPTSATPPAGKPRQPPAPSHLRPRSKPVEEASLTTLPDSGASPAGGGFAVQLGAPPSAQEARDASLRLQKKFGDVLGSYRPSIHEAKSGDKSVFRIRVGGLSQDDAKTLCSKLQTGGGACFVVRN